METKNQKTNNNKMGESVQRKMLAAVYAIVKLKM